MDVKLLILFLAGVVVGGTIYLIPALIRAYNERNRIYPEDLGWNPDEPIVECDEDQYSKTISNAPSRKRIWTTIIFLIIIVSVATLINIRQNNISSIETYIEHIENDPKEQDFIEFCKETDMQLFFEARTNTFVFKYIYMVDAPHDTKEQLIFTTGNSQNWMKSESNRIRQDNSSIKHVAWEYYDIDNNLIISYTF